MPNKWPILFVIFVFFVVGWFSLNSNVMHGVSQHFTTPGKTREILFFFRVPKTGSEMTVLLLQWLQGINGFRHVRLKNTVHRRLDEIEQVTRWCFSKASHLHVATLWLYTRLLKRFTTCFKSISMLKHLQQSLRDEILSTLSTSEQLPVAFDRHVYFTDLGRLYQRTSDVIKMNYFSILRDPIDRIVSQFYYVRATPRPDLRLPPHVSNRPTTKICRSTGVVSLKFPFPFGFPSR